MRVFDAGMGDGTVLTRVMREMHRRFPTMPFYFVAKEISLEDVRLSLEKMADRFFEHPSTVLVVTNMYYTEAPWLTPKSVRAATSLLWHEVALTGTTSHEFSEQIADLEPFLTKNWQARHSPTTGNPIYERPVVLVIYRDDFRFLLDDVIPRQGPRARRLRSGDRLAALPRPRAGRVQGLQGGRAAGPRARAGRQAAGHPLLRARSGSGDRAPAVAGRESVHEPGVTTSCARCAPSSARMRRHYNLNAYADSRAVFRYDMHTLPTEITESIGTSTIFAAWNAAVYVAQIDDERLAEAIGSRQYLDATRDVLQTHGGLWFLDESYVVSRKRG